MAKRRRATSEPGRNRSAPADAEKKNRNGAKKKNRKHVEKRSANPSFADASGTPGAGGETHQIARGDRPVLTTQQGAPVSDDQNSLKLGALGPHLLEDQHFREKIFHFDHERIPERVVHARGYGAHGYFEVYESLADLTTADVLRRPGEKTPAFVRFSTVAGNKGSSDLARDVRGFAVKLYTQEGNWDIVGNNMPVFFIQDPIKFPDLVHAVKAEPDRDFPQAQSAHDNFWDFISLMPESMHMIMWVMSDRAIPRSFRFMEGFGVHTFRLINAEGRSSFVKFHWKPKLKLQSVVWNEAVKINGADPDFHRRDLWNAISEGDFPEWELGLQVFDEEFAESFAFDVLDATKLIPEEDVPIRLVGRLVLDRLVENFFAETEQVAFCTQNIVRGIDFSNDPLLQGRNFSYLDTQVKRLGGPNFSHIPINAPKCPVAHFQQDGHMAMTNPRGRVNYEPNSRGEAGGPRESVQTGFRSFAAPEGGDKLRVRAESFADHYSQARQFFVSQTPNEQKHLSDALVFELSKVEEPAIRVRVVSHLLNIHEALAKSVAAGLGLGTLPKAADAARPTRRDLAPSAALSIAKNGPKNFKGRKLGLLMTDEADARLFTALAESLAKEGAAHEVVAPTIAGVRLSNGELVPAKHTVTGGPSVVFDAVAILVSDEGGKQLAGDPSARDFVADAFAHLKFIGYAPAAMPLLEKAGVANGLDEACLALEGPSDASRFVALCRSLRHWPREFARDPA